MNPYRQTESRIMSFSGGATKKKGLGSGRGSEGRTAAPVARPFRGSCAAGRKEESESSRKEDVPPADAGGLFCL